MNCCIRKALKEDIIFINEIMIQGINDSINHADGDLIRISEWNSNVEYLNDVIEKKDHLLLVAEIEGNIAGVIYGYIMKIPCVPFFLKKKKVYIESLDVLKSYRKKGIGQELILMFEENIKSLGVKIVELDVYSENINAIEFYKHSGYKNIKYRMKKEI